MVDALELAAFAGHVGSTFRVQLPEGRGTVELELVRAAALPAHPGAGRKTPFVLEFRGPAEPALEQGIRRFEHEIVGPVDIFVVPVGPDADGPCYEAIFN